MSDSFNLEIFLESSFNKLFSNFPKTYSKNNIHYYESTQVNKEVISRIIDQLRYLIKNRAYLFKKRGIYYFE